MSWMISPNQTKQLELHIQERQEEKTRILYFSDANLVGLDTTFSATGNMSMTYNLQITAAGLKTNDSTVEYSASWRTTFPEQEVEPTSRKNSEEEDLIPKVLDDYLTDLNRNRIDKTKIGENVFLNIETKKLIGELLTISLNDKKADFKYKNKRLPNDTINLSRIFWKYY